LEDALGSKDSISMSSRMLESFRGESEDTKSDSSEDLRTMGSMSTLSLSPTATKRKPSLDPGTESDDSSSSTTGPRQRRNAKGAVVIQKDKLITVRVPPNHVKAYIKTEAIVDRYFAHCYQSKKFGTIDIFDQRYLLLRYFFLSFFSF
jgi:hypothetical protein